MTILIINENIAGDKPKTTKLALGKPGKWF
jgi:hypothetical protein